MKMPRRFRYCRYPLTFEPFTNRPHLRVRGGRAVFHPTSGYCPRQVKRLVAKLVMSSTYGKFSSGNTSHLNG